MKYKWLKWIGINLYNDKYCYRFNCTNIMYNPAATTFEQWGNSSDW